MNTFLISALICIALGISSAWAAAEPHELLSPHNTEDADNDADSGYSEAPPTAVTSAPIEKLSTDTFGTLAENNGGLPASIWSGSTRESVDVLLEELNSGVADDDLRNLLTRLFLSQSQPPQGTSGNDWLTLRLNALVNLGQDEKVFQMITALPPSLASVQIGELQAQLLLARGEYDKACNSLPQDMHNDVKANAFWKKIDIICKARSGKTDEAMIGLDVLHETGSDDPVLQDAVRHAKDKNVPIKSLPKKLSLMDFAIIRAVGETDRLKDKIDNMPAIAVKYLAEASEADIKLREKATAKALQLGIISASESNRAPEQPFAKPVASDVSTLVTALNSGKPNSDDNAVIARLALDETGIQDNRRIQKLLTLMDIFGYQVPPAIWHKLFSYKTRFDGEVPPAILLERLNQAALANRKGEIILLCGMIIDGTPPSKVSDLALIPVVKALKSAGFEKEARSLAYNAVKSYH